MSIKSLLAILVVSLSLFAPSMAANNSGLVVTGAEFLKACTRADKEWISFCNGYVQAAIDGVRRPGKDICAPTTLTGTKIVIAVVQALTVTPSLRNENAAVVVFAVLYSLFPCK